MNAAGTVLTDAMWARAGDMPAGRKSDPGGPTLARTCPERAEMVVRLHQRAQVRPVRLRDDADRYLRKIHAWAPATGSREPYRRAPEVSGFNVRIMQGLKIVA